MKNNLNFEDSLKRLEEITGKLEEGNIPLENSLKLFEEGITLSRYCEKTLTETERKVEILTTAEIDTYKEDEAPAELHDPPSSIEIVKSGKKKKEKAAESSEEPDENFLF